MARLLLSLLGYRFDVELCRDLDPDTEEPDMRGTVTTYPVGFTGPEPVPYDVDFPDR